MFNKDGTAQGVAKQRLIESLAPANKRVIYDPYAKQFVLGAGMLKLMGHRLSVYLTQKFAPGFHHHLIARTRYIDDLVEQFSGDGYEQYVILGAGYDTRAHRLQLTDTLSIFEVDQEDVQSIKRTQLPSHIKSLQRVQYVSVDFHSQSLSKQLLAAGFDINQRTLFTLEGVSQYITPESFAVTLDEIAKLTNNKNASLIFSYVDERLKSDPIACFGKGYPHAKKRADMVMKLAGSVSEPWVSLYREKDIGNLLHQHGFKVQDSKNLEDLNHVYFAPVGRALPEHQIFKLETFILATSV